MIVKDVTVKFYYKIQFVDFFLNIVVFNVSVEIK